MKRRIALIAMCIGIFIAGCSNQSENPSDDKILDNETKAPVVESEAPSVIPSEVPSEPEPTMEGVVAPTKEAAVETEEPSEVPTVEPTKEPTKAPVTKEPTKAPATKTPTKKPVTTKTPTKAPATKTPTKKPTATKKPNAAGEPYKVGNVTVTPVKDMVVYSRDHGYVRSKPWTGSGSEVLTTQFFSEIHVTGICSNGFYQYQTKIGGKLMTVYTHKDQLYTEKPKELTFKGYDPVKVIKLTHKKLKEKGFTLRTDEKAEVVASIKADINRIKEEIKSMDEGTFDYLTVNCWTDEECQAYYKEKKESLEWCEQRLNNYTYWIDVELHEHKPVSDPDKELGSYQGVFWNKNMNRMTIASCVAVNSSNITCEEDIADELVKQCELNVECGNAFQDYIWIYYGERKQNSGEEVYWFYIT